MNDESGYDSMECCPVKKMKFSELEEAFDVAGGHIGIKPNGDIAKLGGNQDFRIFSLEGNGPSHCSEFSRAGRRPSTIVFLG